MGHKEKGQALIETVLVFPILLLLIVNLFSYGQQFLAHQHLQMAAWAGVTAAVRGEEANPMVMAQIAAEPTLDPAGLTITQEEKTGVTLLELRYRYAQTQTLVATAQRSHSLFGW